MPIKKAFAAAQVRRFSNHPGFPDAAGQAELLTALHDVCERDEQVRDVMDHLIRTLTFAPVAANIHQAAEVLAESKRYADIAPSPYSEVCPRCRGAEWIQSWELITWDENHKRRKREGISRERYLELLSGDETVIEVAKRCPECQRPKGATA